MRYAMIMAGGSGTRLWPMSRQSRPKQLLPLIEGRSLLELAYDRLGEVVPADHRLICTGRRYRQLVREAIPALRPEQILGEPTGRDTVNAVGLTAVALAAGDDDAVFAVLTADHLIEPLAEFQRKLGIGMDLVEADPARLVTFSITPTHPATSYGYVERGDAIPGFPDAFAAERFVEKPDIETARSFLETRRFGWNSGMFVFHAATFLKALERFLPDAFDGLTAIAKAWNTPDRERVLERVYPRLPKISLDYAVMEPAAHDASFRICTVAMDVQWRDVGSWESYRDTLPADAEGNRGNTPTHHIDSRSILAVSDDPAHTICTIGCADLVIIRTADVTLVCPADQAQRVKQMTDLVDSELR